MSSYNKHTHKKSFFHSTGFSLFLVVVCVVLIGSVISMYPKARNAKNNARAKEEHLNDLIKQKEELTAQIEALKTDEGQEALLRNKFNVVKEGEGVIVIVDEDN